MKSFKATLERTRSRLNWIIARVPFDVSKLWGERGHLRVKGTINGFAFRASLFPTGAGEHVLLVNKRMLTGANTSVDRVAQFRLEPDTEKRSVIVPPELARALAEDRALRRWFDALNESTRRWIVGWASGPKSAQARVNRAAQTAECLLETMEAEHELPRMLRTAFARSPQAYQGWQRMSPLRRRGHLLGIFYYRTPAGRARRITKMLKEAYELAEKGKPNPSD